MVIVKGVLGLMLFIIALVLIFILGPISIVYSTFKYLLSFRFKRAWTYINKLLISIAHSIDQTGNVICKDLFNDLLLKKQLYKFGNADETISSALGKSKALNDLNLLGKLVAGILNALDPQHVEKAAQHPSNN